MAFTREKLTETNPEEAQTLDLPDKDFKSTVLNMLRELKESMDKELIKTRRMIYPKISKDTKIIEKNQIEILELKIKIAEVKNSVEEFSSRRI